MAVGRNRKATRRDSGAHVQAVAGFNEFRSTAVFRRVDATGHTRHTSHALTLFQLAIDAMTDTQKRALRSQQSTQL